MSQLTAKTDFKGHDAQFDDLKDPTYRSVIRDWAEFVKLKGNAVASRLLEEAKKPWPPHTLSFDLTSNCNLQCPMCSYHGDDAAEAKFGGKNVEVDDVVSFVERAGGAHSIVFGVMSEPFLRKDIWDCLARLEPMVKEFNFSTNGHPLTQANIEKLSKFPVGWIRISCDAGEEEGYAKWRIGGAFDVFKQRAKDLVDVFGDKVIFHAALFEQNASSLRHAPELLEELGLTVLEFGRLNITGPSQRNGLTRLEGEAFRSFLMQIFQKCQEKGIELRYGPHLMGAEDAEWFFRQTGGQLGCKDFEGYRQTVCEEPNTYLGYELGGNVNFCCGGIRGFPVDGNIFKHDGEALFNAKPTLMIRAMNKAGYTPKACSKFCNKCYRPTI